MNERGIKIWSIVVTLVIVVYFIIISYGFFTTSKTIGTALFQIILSAILLALIFYPTFWHAFRRSLY